MIDYGFIFVLGSISRCQGRSMQWDMGEIAPVENYLFDLAVLSWWADVEL